MGKEKAPEGLKERLVRWDLMLMPGPQLGSLSAKPSRQGAGC